MQYHLWRNHPMHMRSNLLVNEDSVKKTYPTAFARKNNMNGRWYIHRTLEICVVCPSCTKKRTVDGLSPDILGSGQTERDAWASAVKNLKL